VLRALWQRRCYATTGARILLEFAVDGHPMGAELRRAPGDAQVTARVVGEGPVSTVELLQDDRVADRQSGGGRRIVEYRHSVRLEPARTSHLYLRVTQEDGQVAWASPVWVTTEEEGG
jgi:hypothetical protein